MYEQLVYLQRYNGGIRKLGRWPWQACPCGAPTAYVRYAVIAITWFWARGSTDDAPSGRDRGCLLRCRRRRDAHVVESTVVDLIGCSRIAQTRNGWQPSLSHQSSRHTVAAYRVVGYGYAVVFAVLRISYMAHVSCGHDSCAAWLAGRSSGCRGSGGPRGAALRLDNRQRHCLGIALEGDSLCTRASSVFRLVCALSRLLSY